MINVTKSFLPPIEEYQRYLEGIWSRVHLTNHGPLVEELEGKLRKEVGMDHLLYVNNGTLALQIAIKALDLKGEIITTPFSFVATTSAISWENCTPVFADIDSETLNINPTEIRKKITKKTCAILATHVYGNPVDIEEIQKIATEFSLKVIYDASHCFGVKYKGRSIFSYGDISTCSFHATKIFHTVEGGAVFTKNAALIRKLALARNFGFTSYDSFDGVGINGKNSEFHAAMGLCVLKHWEIIMTRRRDQYANYLELFSGEPFSFQKINDHAYYNYAYFPMEFESEQALLTAIEYLNSEQIFPRRYFYPSLTVLDYTNSQKCTVSDELSRRILCLPLHHDLTKENQILITDLVKKSLRGSK